MDKIPITSTIVIDGGNVLEGILELQGDKTVAVHVLFTLLFYPKTRFEFSRFPDCSDAIKIINWIKLNQLSEINYEKEILSFYTEEYLNITDIRGISSIRSSICLLVPLSLLQKKVLFGKVGGCNFTHRPIDRHLALANAFGIKVIKHEDYYEAYYIQEKTKIIFDCSVEGLQSVGVTCHALIAALVFKGELILTNISTDPSVIALVDIIRSKLNIDFDPDNRTIIINTLSKRSAEKYISEIPHDLTVALTYISASLSTKGKIELLGILEMPLSFHNLLNSLSIDFAIKNGISIFSSKGLTNPEVIVCQPSPGIPTDCGPILAAFLCNIKGECIVQDNVYNYRESHIEPLKSMGYDINFRLNTSFIKGKKPNTIANSLEANDIRAGAAVLIGALNRETSTTILNFNEVDRGYSKIVENLQSLGAQIKIIK